MPKCKKKEKNYDPPVQKSSGNVFIDLGYSKTLSINIVARLELMVKIEDIIKENGWTQQQAANILGLTQSRISELMHSRSEKFTIDKLMALLDRLGKRVELTVKTKIRVA